ncbi:transketolase family protein [Desulfitobacterium sp. AusDCA]|uniref:transketolase family protein n=1 Tax=Desulfitobacterium sp. AusDCA TaxID=3240383 RepID=UPI003DA787CC
MAKQATREAYGKALVALGAENSDIVVLDADLSRSTKTANFAKHYPERFFNMGIAEANMMGTAAGLAAAGKIPFASTFAVFATGRAFEQIRNSIAYPKLNVKIAATHSGVTVGEDGGSHQAIEDVAIMRALPNMTVLVPADGEETRQAIYAAAHHKGPVYIRMGRLDVPLLFDENYTFEIGKANVLREGSDVVIFANGVMVAAALEAAEESAKRGINAAVVNVASVKPLDQETIIRMAKATGAVVTAEEHTVIGGLGSAVAEVLAENAPAPMARVGIKDSFGQSGRPYELLEKYGLTSKEIMEAIGEVLKRK